MAGPDIDFAAIYRQLPLAVLLLTPEYVIADANQAYLDLTGRSREQLVGRNAFAAFPDNPANPHATSDDSKASLARVLATGKPDVKSIQRYDVEVEGSPGEYQTRYWNVINAPVFGPDGQIALIIHHLDEITERVDKFIAGLGADEIQDPSE
jgi:PAS domain S-box-containing protein